MGPRELVANLVLYFKSEGTVYSADNWIRKLLDQLHTFEQKILALLALRVYNCETASKIISYLLNLVGIG
ncbi:MAG: hypothetical protein N2654_07800 [Deltaproteobacteria bacterium]|nr:hypothetical protein [Deltaproteobacteria bacterium]